MRVKGMSVRTFEELMKEDEERRERVATDEKHKKLGLCHRERMQPDEPKRGFDGR